MPRLTRDVRQRLLDQNEGAVIHTSYTGKHYSGARVYEIRGGQLHIRSNSNTSWADSRRQSEWVADDQETHRFLYEHQHELNTDGLD